MSTEWGGGGGESHTLAPRLSCTSAAVVRETCSMRERALGAALCKATEVRPSQASNSRSGGSPPPPPPTGVTLPDVRV